MADPACRRSRGLLALAALLTTPACLQDAVARNQAEIEALKQEVAALRPKVRHVADLELRLAELRAEVTELSERLKRRGRGPARPRGTRLQRPTAGTLKLKLPKLAYVARAGGRSERRSLSSHLRRKDGAVLAFWATWCKPCIADGELEHLRKLQRELRREGGDLVSVAVDDLEAVQDHDKADRWIYPLWQGDDAHLKMLPRAFVERTGLSLPLFVVTDGRGEVVAWWKDSLGGGAVRQLVRAATRR